MRSVILAIALLEAAAVTASAVTAAAFCLFCIECTHADSELTEDGYRIGQGSGQTLNDLPSKPRRAINTASLPRAAALGNIVLLGTAARKMPAVNDI
jgi:hypothetical protein